MIANETKPFTLKTMAFALIIVVLYIPLLFLGLNVFVPETQNDCYPKIYVENPNKTESQRIQESQKLQECENNWKKENEKIRTTRLMILAIINFIALLFVFLFNLETPVSYGFFFAATLSTFIFTMEGTRSYGSLFSKIAFGILLMFFVLAIFTIKKLIKK
jgi:hypothetical protein